MSKPDFTNLKENFNPEHWKKAKEMFHYLADIIESDEPMKGIDRDFICHMLVEEAIENCKRRADQRYFRRQRDVLAFLRLMHSRTLNAYEDFWDDPHVYELREQYGEDAPYYKVTTLHGENKIPETEEKH